MALIVNAHSVLLRELFSTPFFSLNWGKLIKFVDFSANLEAIRGGLLVLGLFYGGSSRQKLQDF